MSRSNTIISIISAALVVFLGVSAFVLSFDALKHMAVDVGIDPARAWLYPAIIDGAVIAFSLSVLRANLNQERTYYPWALVGAFTLISVILNILHAPKNLLAQFLGSIPPIALFLSFELFMSQIQAMNLRAQAVQSLEDVMQAVTDKQAELDALIENKTNELDALAGEVERLTVQRTTLGQEIRTLETVPNGETASDTGSIEQARQARASKKQAALEMLLDYVAENPHARLSEIAENIGRSKSTAGTYATQLQENGRLKKNGNGWEVIKS